ncbi:MAG: NAD(P)-dependent oxidoreductase [Pseudomonadota bacterium]
MEILVTGTSGFVGGAVGMYLRGRGHRVTGVSRSAPRTGAVDVAIPHDLTQPMGDLPPFDAVVHAAALSSPWGRPGAYEAANVDGTRHARQVAARTGAPFVLISSSSVLYAAGDQEGLLEETHPTTPPVNDYARTKRAAEAFTMAYGGPWTILRPRAVFGVGDTVLFPRIARAAKLRLLPRFKRNIPARGDLVSIDNLVRQTTRAVEVGARGIFHLIDPAPVSIERFVDDALARVGLPGPVLRVGAPPARRVAGALEALSRRTGWWEPPLTRFGVDVFATTKTFDNRNARDALGAPDIPTEVALDRFAAWWMAGAGLTHPAMQQVGAAP